MIKVIYFMFKSVSALQMILILLITRNQLTICSFIIMLVFIIYNWKFVLNPEKFYNSKKMINDTNKCKSNNINRGLELFKELYLDKECFRRKNWTDLQIMQFQSKVKEVEDEYIEKKHQSKLKMNSYLIKIVMVLITLSFISKI